MSGSATDLGILERKKRMPLLRRVRKEATIRILETGVQLTQGAGPRRVEFLAHLLSAFGKTCLPLRSRLARNMKIAGLFRPGLVDHHFAMALDQFKIIMHILRAGWEGSEAAHHFRFDDSLSHLKEAHQRGKGVLVVAPHLCCYPIVPRVLSDYVPCSIYLRRSPDARKHELNKIVGEAGGGHLVYPPSNGDRFERLTVAMRILREGRVLFMTPDLPRKPHEGVPVRVLDRDLHFPPGMAIMAMRTGAPIVMLDWHQQDGVYRLHCREPMSISKDGDRRERAARTMEVFARFCDETIRAHPEMWWNWLDKRWTRIIREQP